MGDDSERLHLEGLDEATERERWEEHHAGRMTDLPDAVVELTDDERAELATWAREGIYHCPCRMRCMCDDEDKVYLFDAVGFIIAARLAAASGPWAEQLDAATCTRGRAFSISPGEDDGHVWSESGQSTFCRTQGVQTHIDDGECSGCGASVATPAASVIEPRQADDKTSRPTGSGEIEGEKDDPQHRTHPDRIEPEYLDGFCSNPRCDEQIQHSTGPGRRAKYHDAACKQDAEKMQRRLEGRLKHFAAQLEMVQRQLAAYEEVAADDDLRAIVRGSDDE